MNKNVLRRVFENKTKEATKGEENDITRNNIICVYIKIYRTIMLPVVLYGCETWSLTLREEHRLRVFEDMLLRRIFGPKRDEVTRDCRKYA
jgi:hypothetical protein